MYGVARNCKPFTSCNCSFKYSGDLCENCINGYFAAYGENGVVDQYNGLGVDCSCVF